MKGRPLQVFYREPYHLIHPSIIPELEKPPVVDSTTRVFTVAASGFDKNDQYQEMASMSIGLISACNEKIKCAAAFFFFLVPPHKTRQRAAFQRHGVAVKKPTSRGKNRSSLLGRGTFFSSVFSVQPDNRL